MIRMPASKVREEFSETLNRVAYKGDRIVLHRRGKNVAALVSVEDLKLLQELEDRRDNLEAEAALKEPGSNILWEDLKTELGL